VVLAWVNEAQSFFLAGGKEDGVGDDPAVKIDVGLGVDANVGVRFCCHGC
jgi:hypothetical protein